MKTSKLFRKPLIFMVVVFGAIATLSSIIFGQLLDRHMTQEYESKAIALARSVADSDLETILNRDAAAVQSRIDQYLEIQGVSYVAVADERGDIIAHTFTPVIPDSIKRIVADMGQARVSGGGNYISKVTFGNGNFYIHVVQPILNGVAGFVHIGMDRNIIKEYIRAAIIKQQILTLVIFLSCVILAYFFINNISKPLLRLAEYAKKVASHDFSAEIDVESEDEIGVLAGSMRSMSKDISELITGLEAKVEIATQELRTAHDDLELKVRDRTSELTRANTQLKIEIAERKVIGEALRRTEVKYRSIFENAIEGIYQSTFEGQFLSANPSLARIFGYDDADELIVMQSDIAMNLYVEQDRRAEFIRLLNENGEVTNFESQVRRRSGNIIWISENARVVKDNRGDFLYIEGSVEDVTMRKKAEDQLMHQAFHDELTLLPNRSLFLDHLNLALERSKRRTDYLFSVLYLDLDRFKIINDSLGHDIGDDLLKAVAGVLVKCARTMDTVARFGGDEFAVLLEEIAAPRDAIKIAKRILAEISQPFSLQGHEVFTSASIGIVLNTTEYDRPEALLRDADTAMYRAKELGKSRFKVFNQKMHEQAMLLMELETDLRRAVDTEDFFVVYQPIISLVHKRVTGFEALIRWNHPTQGVIAPDCFIPLAEDTGLIYPLDYGMLTRVTDMICKWRDTGLERYFCGNGGLTVNLNISGKHFTHPSLINHVDRILRDTGLDPGTLNLEITESALIEHANMAEDMLGKIKALGLGLCIDDFGTGYSSLSYLQRFPLDTIKIDRSFIANMIREQDTLSIVRTIVNLGLNLGLKVVAEGVETREQLDLLVEAGCGYVQGYYFFKPMVAEKAEEMLRSGEFDKTLGRISI